MGAEHHYVPVFVLKEFASADALPFLPEDALSARDAYLRALAPGGNVRERPILVAEKLPGGVRLVVRPARRCCVARHLYSVPDPSDPVRRGVVLAHLARPLGLQLGRPENDGALVQWAKDLAKLNLDRTCIEDFVNRNIDSPMSAVARRIKAGDTLPNGWKNVIGRFLYFALVRTPHFHARNRVGIEHTTAGLILSYPPFPVHPRHLEVAREFLAHHHSVHCEMGYQLLLADNASPTRRPQFTHADYRIQFLRTAPGGVPFITCDNPARPLNKLRPQGAYKRTVPGFREATTAVIYPISPSLAVAVTRDRNVRDGSSVVVSDIYARSLNSTLLAQAVHEVILPSGRPDLFRKNVELRQSRPYEDPSNPVFRE